MTVKFANFTKTIKRENIEKQKVDTKDDKMKRLNIIKNLWLLSFNRPWLQNWIWENLQKTTGTSIGLSVPARSFKDTVDIEWYQIRRRSLSEKWLNLLTLSKRPIRWLISEMYKWRDNKLWIRLKISDYNGLKQSINKNLKTTKRKPVREINLNEKWLQEVGVEEIAYEEYNKIPPLHVSDNYSKAKELGVFDEINVLDTYAEDLKWKQMPDPIIDDPILVWKHRSAPDIYFVIDARYEDISPENFLKESNNKLYQEWLEQNKKLWENIKSLMS